MPQPSRAEPKKSHTPLAHIPCPASTILIAFAQPMTPPGRGLSKQGQMETRGATGLAHARCSTLHTSLPPRERSLAPRALLAGELRRPPRHLDDNIYATSGAISAPGKPTASPPPLSHPSPRHHCPQHHPGGDRRARPSASLPVVCRPVSRETRGAAAATSGARGRARRGVRGCAGVRCADGAAADGARRSHTTVPHNRTRCAPGGGTGRGRAAARFFPV